MRLYSKELRGNVLAACDRGRTTREVATYFEASESWVRRVKQERREHNKAGCPSLSRPARRAVLPGGGTPPHARCRREAASQSGSSEASRRRPMPSEVPGGSSPTGCRTQPLRAACTALADLGERLMSGRFLPTDSAEEADFFGRLCAHPHVDAQPSLRAI